MSAPPDPPVPPAPRRRVPGDGGPTEFAVRDHRRLIWGVLFLLLGIPAAVGMALGLGPARWSGVASVPLVLALGSGLLAAPLLTRRIVVGPRAVRFQPVGFGLAFRDVLTIEQVLGVPEERRVNRMILLMRRKSLRWLPGRLLWVGRRCVLDVHGGDGSAIHMALLGHLEAAS